MEDVREDVRVALPIEALPSEVASEVSADETCAIRVLERHIERLECKAAEAKSEVNGCKRAPVSSPSERR